MKRSFIRNPEAEVDEREMTFVEEIAARPFRMDALAVILALFIVLPVIYVLVVQTPGSWLPKEKPAAPALPEVATSTPVATSKFAELDSAIIKASNQPTFDNYFNLSFEFYKARKYKESITAAEKALELNPRSAQAYNNICSAYNELKEYQKAKDACTKALEIDPSFQLAKNNLKWAEEQLIKK